ncbi:hypothetical protein HID58_005984 [Brassica napus]|uniref:Uncharacterized protein n=1 Tax=Brassica napus TaxID=3708 RepID=A0ABQ8EAR4_BRANA|nr:hypothetical protein HID58_005984 [Brassica napus]
MPLEPIKFLRKSASIVLGGFVIINVVSTAALGAFRFTAEEKWKKSGLCCRVFRGKGFYICKLCKGNTSSGGASQSVYRVNVRINIYNKPILLYFLSFLCKNTSKFCFFFLFHMGHMTHLTMNCLRH